MEIKGTVLQRYARHDDCERTRKIVVHTFHRNKDVNDAKADRLNRLSVFVSFRVVPATLTIKEE